MAQTSTGIKLSISSGIPATYDLSGYGALTYFEIGEVTNIPQFGAQFQTVTNQPLATGITEKRKGFVNYGDPVIDMALDNSNMGQQMMKSACDGIRKSQVHAFMLQYGNGEIRYWSGRVFSFQEAPGSANNMVGATSQIGITRAILQIPRITLDLSFAENFYSLGGEPKNFSDIITFSRSTTATYINASGVRATAAIDEPCLAYDPLTLEPLGLQVFGAATNLVLNSDALSTQSVTVTAAAHTLHFTGTGTVTLSGAFSGSLVGTGTGEASRASLTFTPTAGSLTLTVTGSVTVAQLEAGDIITPYIPTLGSQVTRAADIATVDDLSGWYNQSQGSVFVEALTNKAAVGGVFELGDDQYDVRLSSRAQLLSATTIVSQSAAATYSTGEFAKIAVTIAENGIITLNGVSYPNTGAASIGVADKLQIGRIDNNTSTAISGYVKTLNYYPSQLTENEMKLITL